ncbi:MAG: efflux RND transporter periplasmic adaptor subunit [Pseudomonadota bacterium]
MARKTSAVPYLKKVARILASTTVTALFIGLAGVLTWQGSSLIADRASAVAAPEATAPITVKVGKIEMQDHFMTRRSFSGQIEAPQSVNIGFENAGTVSTVFFDEGDAVRKGDVLANLDDRLLKAELERLQASRKVLEAQKELAVLTDERQSKLKDRGFATGQAADQSRLSVVEFEARLAEMDSAILAAEIRIEKATITAPFDGKVDQRMIDPGTAVSNGQAILALVEEDKAVFRVGVDPSLTKSVSLGSEVDVRLGDQQIKAKIISILPRIDPVTRTRIIRAELLQDTDLAIGQTGQLVLAETVDEAGVWVPLTAIEDGVRGLWTVKTVETSDQSVVSTEAVEIIHAEEKRAFIRGTFRDNSLIILDGMHRVVSGQIVNIHPQEK